MQIIRLLYTFIKEWIGYLLTFLSLSFKTKNQLKLENIGLRSQLALYEERFQKHNIPKPRPTPAFRQLWVILSKCLTNWHTIIKYVRPKTVISWHRTAFNIHWTEISKPTGRPKISKDWVKLIKQIHQENPLLSPEKIHET